MQVRMGIFDITGLDGLRQFRSLTRSDEANEGARFPATVPPFSRQLAGKQLQNS